MPIDPERAKALEAAVTAIERQYGMPSASAASYCPFGTACRPPRTASAR